MKPFSLQPAKHVSGAGAGAENGAGPKIEWAGAERERSGKRVESAAHNPLKPNNDFPRGVQHWYDV